MFTYEERAVLMLSTELLMANEVMEHSSKTDSEALKVNALIIFKNLALLTGSSLDFCFSTLRIAN